MLAYDGARLEADGCTHEEAQERAFELLMSGGVGMGQAREHISQVEP